MWSRGGGAHLTKPGWSKPHIHSTPTNLALFGHKIALYRFNQGAHTIAEGAQIGAGGWAPLTLTTAYHYKFQHNHCRLCHLTGLWLCWVRAGLDPTRVFKVTFPLRTEAPNLLLYRQLILDVLLKFGRCLKPVSDATAALEGHFEHLLFVTQASMKKALRERRKHRARWL